MQIKNYAIILSITNIRECTNSFQDSSSTRCYFMNKIFNDELVNIIQRSNVITLSDVKGKRQRRRISKTTQLFTKGCLTSPFGQPQPERIGESELQSSIRSQVELQSLMSLR